MTTNVSEAPWIEVDPVLEADMEAAKRIAAEHKPLCEHYRRLSRSFGESDVRTLPAGTAGSTDPLDRFHRARVRLRELEHALLELCRDELPPRASFNEMPTDAIRHHLEPPTYSWNELARYFDLVNAIGVDPVCVRKLGVLHSWRSRLSRARQGGFAHGLIDMDGLIPKKREIPT